MPPSVGLCYFEAHELETDRKSRRPARPRSAAGDDPRILCATRGTGSLDAPVVAARHRRSSHRKLRHGRRPLAADRSEERRVGTESVSQCRTRRAPYKENKNNTKYESTHMLL